MNLMDNILAQMEQMELAGKLPRALQIDRYSLASLINESGFGELVLPGVTLFGLTIERSHEPNFEVVE